MDLWSGGWCIGTSSVAVEAYLGALQNQIRHRVCPCGIPCREYRVVVNTPKSTIRESLNWPQDAKVLLHVGRHTEQKNLFFLLNIFAEVLSREKNMLCVLAGSGPLTSALQARAEALGMAESVRFLGIRDDVPLLMRAADLFILPSLWEGFGLVVVEAQAVGLRSLVADVLPPEVQLVDGLVHRVSLQEPPVVWVDQALQLLREPLTDANFCLGAVEASPFSITNSAKTLMELYKESQA
jgi:glycosyltransferase EpsF